MHVDLSTCRENQFLLECQRHSPLRTLSTAHFRLYIQFYSGMILSFSCLKSHSYFFLFFKVGVVFVFVFFLFKVPNHFLLKFFVIFISIIPKTADSQRVC